MNKEKIIKGAVASAQICGLAFMLGFGIETYKPAPDNTLVYVVEETKHFYPANRDYIKFMDYYEYEYNTMTIKEARKSGYTIDRDARERGYFTQKGRSLSGKLLQKIGILPEIESYWKPDGTWR